jgi:hypothetical protein
MPRHASVVRTGPRRCHGYDGRNRWRRMLAAALEAEVDAYLADLAGQRGEDGRRHARLGIPQVYTTSIVHGSKLLTLGSNARRAYGVAGYARTGGLRPRLDPSQARLPPRLVVLRAFSAVNLGAVLESQVRQSAVEGPR